MATKTHMPGCSSNSGSAHRDLFGANGCDAPVLLPNMPLSMRSVLATKDVQRKPAQKPMQSAVRLVGMAPNGEVEGPDDHARQAPRAHTVFPRPRRVTTHRSRTPPTIVRPQARKCDKPKHQACGCAQTAKRHHAFGGAGVIRNPEGQKFSGATQHG